MLFAIFGMLASHSSEGTQRERYPFRRKKCKSASRGSSLGRPVRLSRGWWYPLRSQSSRHPYAFILARRASKVRILNQGLSASAKFSKRRNQPVHFFGRVVV